MALMRKRLLLVFAFAVLGITSLQSYAEETQVRDELNTYRDKASSVDKGQKPASLKDSYEVHYGSEENERQRFAVYKYFYKEFDEINNLRNADKELKENFGQASLKDVQVDLYDLNGDGEKEIIANPSAYPIFCWGTGCTLYVFQKAPKTNQLNLILEVGGKGGLYIGPEIKNGYKVIKYYDGSSKVTNWIWNSENRLYQ